MRQKLFLIFSTAIILSNIWLVMKNQILKDNYSGLENNYFELKREKNKIEVLNSKIQDQMLYNWENEGQELAHEKLKEYLSKQINCLPPKVKYPKLIFRYSQLTCQTCADSQIDLLKEASEIIGNENIIIIPSYEKEQNFVLFKQQNQISFGMTNVDSLRIPIEKYNFFCTEPLETRLWFISHIEKKYIKLKCNKI